MLENAVGQEGCMAGTLDSWKVPDLEIMKLMPFLSNEPFGFVSFMLPSVFADFIELFIFLAHFDIVLVKAGNLFSWSLNLGVLCVDFD